MQVPQVGYSVWAWVLLAAQLLVGALITKAPMVITIAVQEIIALTVMVQLVARVVFRIKP